MSTENLGFSSISKAKRTMNGVWIHDFWYCDSSRCVHWKIDQHFSNSNRIYFSRMHFGECSGCYITIKFLRISPIDKNNTQLSFSTLQWDFSSYSHKINMIYFFILLEYGQGIEFHFFKKLSGSCTSHEHLSFIIHWILCKPISKVIFFRNRLPQI